MDRATVIELADFINSEDEIDPGLINKLRDIQGKIYLLHSTEGGVSLGEGIDTEDIFSYIHNCCKESHTDINMVTLVWGNANSEQLYTDWCSHNNIKPQLTVITINRWCGVVHDFTTDYSKHYERNYKANKPLDKLFTFLSRARRQHRVDILNALCDITLYNIIVCSCWLVSQGAEPLFFHEHLAIPKLDAHQAMQLVTGVSDGCVEARLHV